MKKVFLAGAFLSLVAFLTACGATLKITTEMNGQKVTLKKGETLTIELAGNPTTGYNWEVSDVDQNVLVPAGDDYKSDSNLIGSGGTYTFKFKAVESGSTNLKLIYYRSFEADIPPVETFEIFVEVK